MLLRVLFSILVLQAWVTLAHALPSFQAHCAVPCDTRALKPFEVQAQTAFAAVTEMLDVQKEFEATIFTVTFESLGDHVGEAHVVPSPRADQKNFLVKIEKSLLGNNQAQMVFVHELTHLIRHHFNPKEISWAQEGLAGLVESLYTSLWPRNTELVLRKSSFLGLLDTESDTVATRGADATAHFFFQYLYQNLGQDAFIRQFVRNPLKGWDALEGTAQVLAKLKWHFIPQEYLDRLSLWRHFALALFLNRLDVGPLGIYFVSNDFAPLMPERGRPSPLKVPLPQRPWMISYASSAKQIFDMKKEFEKSGRLAVLHVYGIGNKEGVPVPFVIRSESELLRFDQFVVVTSDQ